MAYVRVMILSKFSNSNYLLPGDTTRREISVGYAWLLNPKEEKGQEFDKYYGIQEGSWTMPGMKLLPFDRNIKPIVHCCTVTS